MDKFLLWLGFTRPRFMRGRRSVVSRIEPYTMYDPIKRWRY